MRTINASISIFPDLDIEYSVLVICLLIFCLKSNI